MNQQETVCPVTSNDTGSHKRIPDWRPQNDSITGWSGFRCIPLLSLCFFLVLVIPALAQQAGQNVNMVSGTVWPYGDPFLERQNEPSLAVSTRNPLHLLAGANDYRTVDLNLPEAEPGEGQLSNAPTGEPWVGQYVSVDGGAHWQSTLLPGYPQDTSARGTSSPLHGFTTAADPVLASGTNGMFYYGGIAFNRGSSLGLVFVARFMDLNNKENGDISRDSFPIRYINTIPVAYGTVTPSQFLDKPAIAVDIPRGTNTCSFSVTQSDGTVVQQKIPAGNVYVAYADVVTSANGTQTSTIYFSRSANCGTTWSAPIPISKSYAISQGATIQIDPETGIVYVAWRVIHSAQQPKDGIAITASLNGGQSFLPALTVVSLPAFNSNNPSAAALFDQNTSETTFRTTAYPAMAVGDSGIALVPGPLYLAWSQRGQGPNGEARIMMLAVPGNASITSSGFKPPTPFPIDNGAVTNDQGGTFPTLTAGHQVMPSMTFNQGKLMVVYYDLRQDHTIGEFTPSAVNGIFTPDANGNFFEETRDDVMEFPTASYSPYFIDDAGLTVRRHTMDVILAQANAGYTVPKFSLSRVSHYDLGLFEGEPSGETAPFHQLKFDPPNLPMFVHGTGAFMGDYIGITGQPFVLVKCGSSQCWTYNNPSPPGVAGTILAAPKPAPSSPVHYASFTSNQDVIPPADGMWDNYTAISNGTSVYNPNAAVPTCQPGDEGDRNQNVYESRITQGLVVSSPQVSKPLNSSVQRGFVVLVQNQTSGRSTANGPVNYFRLTIANQPANGFASFAQLVPPSPVPNPPFPTRNNGTTFPLTSIDVAIAPHTGVARTVFAVSTTPTANILVNVNEITALGGSVVAGGLSGFLLLNADGTVPTNLVDPNGQTGGTSIANVELYNPNVAAPNVAAPNVAAPNVAAPNVAAPNVAAPNVAAPNVAAPNVAAPNVAAYGVANPNVAAPNVAAPNVAAAPPTDATYTVTNNGNTTASFNVALTGSTATPLQLLLSQIYMTPQTDGQCHLITQQQDITLANVPNVPLTNVNQLGNPNVAAAPVTAPTLALGPGESALITIRGNVDIPTMQQIVTQVAPVVVPQAVNSNSTTATQPPPIYPPLAIVTTTLPPTDRGDQGYSVQLVSMGGKPGTGTWSILSGTLPPGINISPSGLVSGTATTPGSYLVTIQVTDTNTPPAVATQNYVFNVSLQFAEQFVTTPGDGVVGQPYVATPLVVTGGTTPYTFTAAGLPAGLSINPSTGQITGTPTIANPAGSSVLITATDAAFPPESITYTPTIRIGAVIQISPAALPGGLLGVSYSFQLNATGGIGGLVFGPPGLPAGGTLDSNGTITFANPQVPSVSFSVSVHDQANPFQVQTANYTITFVSTVSNLSFITQPSNTLVNQAITPAVRVRALDNSAAVLPGVAITLTLNSGPGTLSGTFTQLTDGSGIATFANLAINAAGTGDTLRASAAAVTATSNPFNVTAPTIACAPTPGPLLSWWPFNGNALDIRGGRPGTPVGSGGSFSAGEVGSGFQSGGEGSAITVPAAPFLVPVNFSVGAWIKINSISNDPTMQIVWIGDSHGTDLSTPYSLSIQGNGSFSTSPGATVVGTPTPGKVLAIITDGLNELDVFSNTVLQPGVFYYVTLIWRGPLVGASIWINGQLDQTGVGSAIGLRNPTNPFQIGGIAGGTVGSFNGVIDELQVWGNILTQFQMQTIYNAGSAGQCQAIWFTEWNGSTGRIGSIATDGSNAAEYTPPTANGFPYGIAEGSDGNVWFTEYNPNNVGEFISLGGGAGIGEIPITGFPGASNLYQPENITSGPDGSLWFTESRCVTDLCFVGSITTGGTINTYQTPTADSPPNGITAGPDGNLWFTEAGPGTRSAIAKVTTSGTSTDYSTPTSGSSPVSITTGADGNLWFAEAAVNQIGVINTAGTVLHEYPIPAGLSGVSIAAAGSGYQTGDVVTVLESGATGGTLVVGDVNAQGGVLNFKSTGSIGTGYSIANSLNTSWGQTITLPVNPKATYLAMNPSDPGVVPAVPISLSALGVQPGQTITLTSTGMVDYCVGYPPCDSYYPVGGLAGLFSSNTSVAGAIAVAGAPAYVYTAPAGGFQPPDIPQDFLVNPIPGTTVMVPQGAAYLFVILGDDYYSDNAGQNLAVQIATGGHGLGLQVNIVSTTNAFGPAGMTLGPDGNVWFAATNQSNLINVTPAGQFAAFPVPNQGNALFLTAGPDGNIWYTDNLLNTIGRLTLSSGTVTEFPTPTAGSGPWGIATGPTVLSIPAPPTSVTAAPNAGGAPVINWTASTSSGVIGYNVYRATSPNGPFTLMNSSLIVSTTFTDLNAPGLSCPGTTYYYFVTAVGTGNTESGSSNEPSVVVSGSC